LTAQDLILQQERRMIVWRKMSRRKEAGKKLGLVHAVGFCLF
jgi:hypothetical protein